MLVPESLYESGNAPQRRACKKTKWGVVQPRETGDGLEFRLQAKYGVSYTFRLQAEFHAALMIHCGERKNGGETDLAAARS